jgi:hypothetical protein
VVFRQKQMPCEGQSRLFAAAPDHRVADMNSQIERIFFRSNASVNLVILFLLYVVLLAITYFILVYFRRSYITLWPNDVMGLIDIAYRVHIGQVPYKDFHLFYGPLVPVVPAVGLALGLQGGAIFGVNGLIAAAVVLPPAAVLSARRSTLPAAVLAFVFLWLLIVVPMAEGHSHDDLTWATFYNRHGWRRSPRCCCSTPRQTARGASASGSMLPRWRCSSSSAYTPRSVSA